MKSHSQSERIITAQEIIENQRFEEPYGVFVLRQGIIHAMRKIMAQVTEPNMMPAHTWDSAPIGCESVMIPQRNASVCIDFNLQRLLNVQSNDIDVVNNVVQQLCNKIVKKRKLTPPKKPTDAVFWLNTSYDDDGDSRLEISLHKIELVKGFSDQELKMIDDMIDLGQYGSDKLKNGDYVWWFGAGRDDDGLDITPFQRRRERFITISQCQPEPSLRDIIMRMQAAMAKASTQASSSG